MKKSDCFLMQGATLEEPMTLYYITDMNKDKIRALSIFINDDMVQGLDDDSEYDNDIPEEAIPRPSWAYEGVKRSMKTFVNKIKAYIKDRVIEGDFQIEIGGHYYDGHIHTVTEIGEERVKYKLFRLEDENISPSWSGDAPFDSIKDYCLPISEQTYQEVLQVYQNYVDNLRIVLFKNKDIQNLKMDL